MICRTCEYEKPANRKTCADVGQINVHKKKKRKGEAL